MHSFHIAIPKRYTPPPMWDYLLSQLRLPRPPLADPPLSLSRRVLRLLLLPLLLIRLGLPQLCLRALAILALRARVLLCGLYYIGAEIGDGRGGGFDFFGEVGKDCGLGIDCGCGWCGFSVGDGAWGLVGGVRWGGCTRGAGESLRWGFGIVGREWVGGFGEREHAGDFAEAGCSEKGSLYGGEDDGDEEVELQGGRHEGGEQQRQGGEYIGQRFRHAFTHGVDARLAAFLFNC